MEAFFLAYDNTAGTVVVAYCNTTYYYSTWYCDCTFKTCRRNKTSLYNLLLSTVVVPGTVRTSSVLLILLVQVPVQYVVMMVDGAQVVRGVFSNYLFEIFKRSKLLFIIVFCIFVLSNFISCRLLCTFELLILMT